MNIKTYQLLTLWISSSLALSGCGALQEKKDDSGRNAAGGSSAGYAITVATDADLPECAGSYESQLAFSIESRQFFLCLEGEWTEVVGPGKDGESGSQGLVVVNDLGSGCKELLTGNDSDGDGKLSAKDAGYHREVLCNAGGENLPEAAFNLYSQYRRSVYRIEVTCAYPGGAAATSHSGSGFRCGEERVCTAGHVAACQRTSGGNKVNGTISAIEMRMIAGPSDADTVDTSDPQETDNILYQSASPTVEKAAACADIAGALDGTCIDLARFVVPAADFSDDMAIMPLTAEKPSAGCEPPAAEDCQPFPRALTPVLSMSFPLGFQELYSDLGEVNTNDIDGCSPSFPCSWLDFSTNNVTDGGSSGSPLISVATGDVIGVLVSGTTPQQNANFSWAIGGWMFEDSF